MNFKLIEKYIQGEASEEEIEIIINATLASPKFKEELIERIKINALTIDVESDIDLEWSNFLQKRRNATKQKRYQMLFKVAAVLIIGLFIGSLVFNSNNRKNLENEIVLELSNGTKKIINTAKNLKIVNEEGIIVGVQIDNKIVFSNNKTKDNTIQYNTLHVPLGKRFQVEFSDGSIAYLNSGTKIKFPVQFKNGMSRKVFLDGEAFFEVAKNINDSFIVSTATLDTKVYGTKFNVSAYKSDLKSEVVLVEGKVSVYKSRLESDKGEMTYLKPHQMASLKNTAKNIRVSSINTNDYTSWIRGELVFNDLPFSDIVRKLERHYNVKIENNYTELNTIHFTGSFDTESISQVLKTFSNYRAFQYEINSNQININSTNKH